MQAADVMSRDVVAVTPEASIEEVVAALMAHHISALPVVDHDDRLVGIVSEGDLIRRPEVAGERVVSWWLKLLGDTAAEARDYVRTHGQTAGDVMTRQVVTVSPTTPLPQIVELLEKHRVRRAPVVLDGKLVGIVSRADLLRALVERVSTHAEKAALNDESIRERLAAELKRHGWDSPWLNMWVEDGVVHIAGAANDGNVREAMVVAARGIPGVKGVVVRFGTIPDWV